MGTHSASKREFSSRSTAFLLWKHDPPPEAVVMNCDYLCGIEQCFPSELDPGVRLSIVLHHFREWSVGEVPERCRKGEKFIVDSGRPEEIQRALREIRRKERE